MFLHLSVIHSVHGGGPFGGVSIQGVVPSRGWGSIQAVGFDPGGSIQGSDTRWVSSRGFP